jgi:formiminotetrahydrofolate cyclodeaminase
MLAQTKLADFAEAVAAKTPTPGGGSVSAAVAALGAALGIMTSRYSDSPDTERALDPVKNEFLGLVDQDADAYGQVSSAMALPKGSDEDKKRRREALQNALSEAADVPLKGMMLGVRALDALRGLAPRCNKHLISDLASAVYFLDAAVLGCGENVRINAVSITDKPRRERLEKDRSRLLAEAADHRGAILREVEKLYGGK